MIDAPSRGWRGVARTLVACGVLAVLLFPGYWMINVSLQPLSNLYTESVHWIPVPLTTSGYSDALSGTFSGLITSLTVALGVVLVSIAVAAPASFALAQLKLPGTLSFLFVLLIVQMVPSIVMSNSLFVLFTRLHLVDTYWGLILADATASIPFAILILRAFMLEIPKELIDAARIDGAGYIRTFVSIILPLSRNALVTAALFSFLFAWGDFLFAVTLTSGQSITPITVGIYNFIGARNPNWNAVMATAVVASIPAAVMLISAQRVLAAGITSGSVKG